MTHLILISPSEKVITQTTSEKVCDLLKKNKYIQIASIEAFNLKFYQDPENKFKYIPGKDLVSKYKI